MKIARFFACIFAFIGSVLLIGSMGFFLWNRDGQTQVLELPREAATCCDRFVQALNDGDLEAAAQLMYGRPDLGVSGVPEDPESALLWEAFRGSIRVELTEDWAVEQGELVRRGSISALDVSSVLGTFPERIQPLVDQRIASAENLNEIYDENNAFREELMEQLLRQALQEAISQDAQPVTGEVTLKMVKRDGTWWVVPQQNLLQILSGLA